MRRTILGLSFLACLAMGTMAQVDRDLGFFEEEATGLEVKTFVLSLEDGGTMNCYLAWDSGSRQAWVIDPGAPAPALLEFIRSQRLHVLAVLNTHGHYDHVGGNAYLAARLDAPFYLQRADHALAAKTAGPEFVFCDYPGDSRLQLGGLEIEIIGTPGHTPGSVCLKSRDILFSGDTLFAGGIGKAYGGNPRQRQANLRLEVDRIRKRLLPLSPLTRVLPGHGPATTIGAERVFNAFLQ